MWQLGWAKEDFYWVRLHSNLFQFTVRRSTLATPEVVVYGNPGSFTFNPLANWPIVILQGNAVLGTYGIIIIWALILGAIVWGISFSGQFSNFFSGDSIKWIITRLTWRLFSAPPPLLESFRMSRNDTEFSPFIFLLILQGPKYSFYINLES